MSDNSFPLTGCVHSSTKNVFFTLYFPSEASRTLSVLEPRGCCFTWKSRRRCRWWLWPGPRFVSSPPSELGPAHRGPSLCAQTHRSTQTHNTNPNMADRRQFGKAAVWLIWCLKLRVLLSMEMSITPNTGLFVDKSTTQCDRYKCGSAVVKETGWLSRRGEEPKEGRVFLEINERDGLIDADRPFWGRSGSSSTQRNLHVELCTFELQQLEPLCHVKTLKSFGKKRNEYDLNNRRWKFMFEALQSFQPRLRAHSVFTHYFSYTAVDCSNKDGLVEEKHHNDFKEVKTLVIIWLFPFILVFGTISTSSSTI